MSTGKPAADDALPEPGITTALVIDEAGRHVPMRLVGAYYTADQLRAAIARAIERTIKIQNENL